METLRNTTAQGVEAMVDAFYSSALADPLLGPVFRDVAGFDLEAHAPIMYRFWRSLIFDTHEYRGNAFAPHLRIHALQPLTQAHFDRWLVLFGAAADGHLAPEAAAVAKMKAGNIARIMAAKLAA